MVLLVVTTAKNPYPDMLMQLESRSSFSKI